MQEASLGRHHGEGIIGQAPRRRCHGGGTTKEPSQRRHHCGRSIMGQSSSFFVGADSLKLTHCDPGRGAPQSLRRIHMQATHAQGGHSPTTEEDHQEEEDDGRASVSLPQFLTRHVKSRCNPKEHEEQEGPPGSCGNQ